MEHHIRLGSVLSFDEQKEADIIKVIEYLNSSHKTGQFMSNLIRIAFDCPEILSRNASGNLETGERVKAIEQLGFSDTRKAFINAVTKEVSDMKSKVDKVYDMTLKLYTLAQMGNRLGIEDKTKNLMISQFIIEKQLQELQTLLGVTLQDNIYASNKAANTEKIADEALEYIIESYGSLLTEMSENLRPTAVIQQVPVQQVAITQEQVSSTPVENKVTEEVKAMDTVEQTESVEESENEPINFDDADISALSNFFGI